jgi:hypothetical protein
MAPSKSKSRVFRVGRPKGSTSKLLFKQSEVERAIRGVQTQGLTVKCVEVDPHTGKISVYAEAKQDAA